MAISLCLGCLVLSLMLILSGFGSFRSYGANMTSVNIDESGLVQLDAEYVNWNINLPTEQLPEEGNQCVIMLDRTGSVNFLVDPFSKGTVVQTCEIKSGSSLFFPLYEGWCDSGIKGYYRNQSYTKMLDCALDSDKGIATMVAWLDNNRIIDIKVNNMNIHDPKVVYDNFPQNEYYKVITSPDFFDLTLTNKTRFADSFYEKPEEFQTSPVIYKAVAHCFCGLVTNLTAGTHELRYKTVIEGTGGAAVGGWDQVTDITYKFNVRQ